MTDDAAAAERRARKAAVKAENLERIENEVADLLKRVEAVTAFQDLSSMHNELRSKITEIQNLTIQGQFDARKSIEFEQRIVAHIHDIEEKARQLQTGQHVPKPGE